MTEEQIERHRETARKYSKTLYDKKVKENPNWNAERQRKYRKEHPESFNKAMCKCFMKKIGKEVTLELVKELFGEKK